MCEWTPPSEIWWGGACVQRGACVGCFGGDTYETEEVQAAVPLLCVLTALDDDLVLVELALLDALVDLDDVLPHDAPRADVQVSVAHQCRTREMRIRDRLRTRLPSCP